MEKVYTFFSLDTQKPSKFEGLEKHRRMKHNHASFGKGNTSELGGLEGPKGGGQTAQTC